MNLMEHRMEVPSTSHGRPRGRLPSISTPDHNASTAQLTSYRQARIGGFGAHSAAHGDDQLAHQAEPDARTGGSARELVFGAEKWLEDQVELVATDAGAAVADADRDSAVTGTGDDLNGRIAPGRTVFDGVVDQVEQHLLERVRIEAHGGVSGAVLELEPSAVALCVRAQHLEAFLDHGRDVAGHDLELLCLAFEAREREHVLDETREAFALTRDGPVVLVPLGFGDDEIVLEHLGV